MLSVKDIHAMTGKKKQVKKDLYKSILISFSHKIKTSVELSQTQTFLTVPSFVIGFPMFDRGVAREYLLRQLKNLGYQATAYSQHEIYVTWARGSGGVQVTDDHETLPAFVNLHKFAESFKNKKNSAY
jgi:Family of unknown function (DUF5759)